MPTDITRRIEFDAGHRIPDHKSKCRNIHGHRYVLECTISGPTKDDAGASDNGMVLDFGDLKEFMTGLIGEPWDHALLVWKDDKPLMTVMEAFDALVDDHAPEAPRSHHKTVVLDFPPTVERMAEHIWSVLARAISAPIHLKRVKLWETPNCFAEVTPDSFIPAYQR